VRDQRSVVANEDGKSNKELIAEMNAKKATKLTAAVP
jgi:hypothetical protein